MAAQLLHDFATPSEWFTRLADVNADFLAIGHRFGSTGVEREYENIVSVMLSFSIWFDRRRARVRKHRLSHSIFKAVFAI